MGEATVQWRYPEVVGRYVIKIGYRPALEDSVYQDIRGLEWFLSVLNTQCGITAEIQVVSESAAIKAKFDLVNMLGD